MCLYIYIDVPAGIGDPLVASRLSNIHGGGGSTGSVELASTRRLRLENERLVAEVARLRRLLFSGAARGEVGSEDAALEEEARFVALEMELQHAKEALQALKADRKRLKAEKFDLLNQMKALYGTLEDKERELRDFIRNYEQVILFFIKYQCCRTYDRNLCSLVLRKIIENFNEITENFSFFYL